MKKIFFIFLIFTIACLKQPTEKQVISSDFLKIIEKIPPTRISVYDPLSFDFLFEIPEAELKKEVNAKEVFEFEPNIEGHSWWERKDLLIFAPFSRFKPGTNYKCKLKLSLLSEKFKDLPPLEISFQTYKNEIKDFKHFFEKDLTSESPNAQLLNASFTMIEDKIKIEDVKEAMSLKLNDRKLDFSLKKVDSIYLIKASFETPENGGEILISFDVDKLILPKDYSFKLPIAPIKKFKVENLNVQWEMEGPIIYLTFSHPIKEDEDFDTFIRIEPSLELKYFPLGNTLKILGDFKHNENYKLICLKGFKSFLGEKILEDQTFSFKLTDLPPEIKITESRIYLSSKSEKYFRFKTVNISKLRINAYYIPPQNVIFFLQKFEEKDMNKDYYDYNRIAKRIYSEKINILAEKNKWIEQDLNLNIPQGFPERGIFFIDFNFTREDTLWECKKEADENYYEYYDDYYNNPCSYSYYYNKGKAYAYVIISDISLLALKEKDKWNLWAYNVLTSKPESGVEIEAYEYHNFLLEKNTTDSKGYASFSKEDISFFIAKKGDSFSFIRTSSPPPPLEPFELKGVYSQAKGIRAFAYTERGVYRPSDEIHLTAILREDNTKPVDIPLKCVFSNPLNQETAEIINKEPINGVYYFKLKTSIDDPTGIWNAKLYFGKDLVVSHPIKVEMIVPPKIKPEIKIEKEKIFLEDLPLSFEVSSSYLFGAPSSGLNYNLKAKLTNAEISFPKFKDFTFSTPYKKYLKEEKIAESILDENGRANVKWDFKKTEREEIPAFINTDLILEVTEKGGRPAYDKKILTLYPYNYYVGVKFDKDKVYKTGDSLNIPFIVVDKNGNAVPERDIEVKIYFSRYYWWWEIRDYREIIQSVYTELKNVQNIKSKSEPSYFEISLTDSYGSYFVEIKDKAEKESLFFKIPVGYWGEKEREKGENYLKYEGLKDEYKISEITDISIFTPPSGTLFYAIVKGDQILDWVEREINGTKEKINLKITKEMVPSVYLFISAIQKLENKNDMPLRSYAIIPINIIPEKGKLEMEVTCPNKVKPKENFPVKIKLLNSKEAVVTLAVVDSGLINLTQEKTPDPYKFFYQKIAFDLSYRDSFDYFYGLMEIPAEYTYKVGGEAPSKKLLTSPVKSNPFPPVVFFKGPIHIKNEKEIDVLLPNYLGEVKVIVVGVWDGSYGSYSKFIKIVDDLIPYGTFPRAVAPGDEFEIPLQLFIQENKKEKIKIEISSSKHFEILKEKKVEVPFEKGEKMIYFAAKAKENEIGEGFIKIELKGKKKYETSQVIPIHPINTYISKNDFFTLSKGEEKEIKVPILGFLDLASATLTFSNYVNMPLKSIYERVLNFPFGCIEQTSSKLFATLFLRDLVIAYGEIFPGLNKNKLDSILENGFFRLQNFILPEGNFTFWPGERSPASDWTNVYVAHLLVEANKRGFALQSFVDKVINYHKVKARSKIENERAQAYRLFVLSLNNSPDYSSMNLLKENYLNKMDVKSKLMLSAAYAISNDISTAKSILQSIGKIEEVPQNYEYFYSNVGHHGNYLFFLSKIDRDIASKFFSTISDFLNKDFWWSTHDSGWLCAGYSSYLNALKGFSKKIKAKIIYPDGREEKIEKETDLYTIELKNYFNKNIKIKNQSESTIFLNLTSTGIPIEVPKTESYRNMKLTVSYFDENGQKIDVNNIKMGSVIYEKITLQLLNQTNHIAISQILPGGWEPINLRLLKQTLPKWVSDSSNPSYTDIRDDRVNIFIDFPGYENYFNFYIPIKVVTKGKFIIPPTTAQAMYNPDYFVILPQGYINVE